LTCRQVCKLTNSIPMKSTMNYFFRFVFLCTVSLVVSGCATYSGIWNAERPPQPIKNLNLVIDVTALSMVELSADRNSKVDGDSPLMTKIGSALSQELRTQLNASGVNATIKLMPLRKEVTQQGTTISVKTFSPSVDEMVGLFVSADDYVLIMRIDRYFVNQSTSEWTGLVNFGYKLVKIDDWTKDKKVAWDFQSGVGTFNVGATKVIDFKAQDCNADVHSVCISRLVGDLLETLRGQRIIIKR
jgi:hypothetical protein